MSTFTSYQYTGQMSQTGDSTVGISSNGYILGAFTANITTTVTALQMVLNGAGNNSSGLYWWVYDATAGTYVSGQASAPNLLTCPGGGFATATVSTSFPVTAGHAYEIYGEWDENYSNQVEGAYYANGLDFNSDSYATWNSNTYNGYPWLMALEFEVPNNPPNPPTWEGITSGGSTINVNPHLEMSVSDPDAGNTIQNVEVQIATDSAFSSLVADDTYTQFPARFTGMPTTTNTVSNVWYLNPNPNPVGTIYARARATDNIGATGNWSATQSFTVATAPWTDTPSGYGMLASWINDLTTVINDGLAMRGPAQFPMFNLDNTWDIQPWQIAIKRSILAWLVLNFGDGVQPTFSSDALNVINSLNSMSAGWLNGNTSSVGKWSSQNSATLALMTDGTQFIGNSYFRLTSTYSAGTQAMTLGDVGKSGVSDYTATAGDTYSAEMWVRGTSGVIGGMNMWFLDSGRNVVGIASSPNITYNGSWQRVRITGQVAPTNTTQMYTEAVANNVANGDTLDVGYSAIYNGDPWQEDRSGQHIIELRNACAQI